MNHVNIYEFSMLYRKSIIHKNKSIEIAKFD